MEIAITKMSANGQIVIPSEIRKEAGIKPAEKFIVASQGKDILLKRIDKKQLAAEISLMKKIRKAEENIKKGNYLSVDGSLTAEEINDILMKHKFPKKRK